MASSKCRSFKKDQQTLAEIRVDKRGENKRNEETNYDLNDLIGSFGFYQISVMLFSSLREAIHAFDSIVASLALPSDETFGCVINEKLDQRYLNLQQQETDYDPRCYYINTVNTTVVACKQWTFQDKYSNTMLAEWNLVCERHHLNSMVLSSFFAGLLLGIAFWGPLSDKIGRWKSYSLCHTAYLIFGGAAVFAPDVYWFMVFRFLAGFNAVGYQILPTLQIEIIPTKNRTLYNTFNHTGWGLGVILVPLFGHFIHNWRYLIAVAPIVNAILVPYMLFSLPESIRWMILQGQMEKARKEIKRGAKWNRLTHHDFDQKIDTFFATKKLDQATNSSESRGSFKKLFTNSTLFQGLATLCLVLFALFYIYYGRTLHFAPDEASVVANFVITGLSEWTCLFLSAISMCYMARKTCLALFLGIMSIASLTEAIVHGSLEFVWPQFNLITDSVIKLFDMCSIMVTFLVMLEIFPTELRQTGVTIILIFGSIGTVMGPYQVEFEQVLSRYHVQHAFLIALITIALSISIKFFLRETGKSDIVDCVDGVENDDRKQIRQSDQRQSTNNTKQDMINC